MMTVNLPVAPVAAITVISENHLQQRRRGRNLRETENRRAKKRNKAETWAGFADVLGDSGTRFSRQA